MPMRAAAPPRRGLHSVCSWQCQAAPSPWRAMATSRSRANASVGTSCSATTAAGRGTGSGTTQHPRNGDGAKACWCPSQSRPSCLPFDLISIRIIHMRCCCHSSLPCQWRAGGLGPRRARRSGEAHRAGADTARATWCAGRSCHHDARAWPRNASTVVAGPNEYSTKNKTEKSS